MEKPSDILSADKLLFPGVGAFEQAMGALKDRGYVDALREYIQVHLSGSLMHSHISTNTYVRPSCNLSAMSLAKLCA